MIISKNGYQLKVGDRVLRAMVVGKSPRLEIRTVERITEKGLFLNGSGGSRLMFPERLWRI